MGKLFVTEQSEGKKCGGCNWETGTFYGIGNDKKDATSNFDEIEGYGKGLCSNCMCDLLSEPKSRYAITDTKKRK
jgi:hypothetical protein